MGHRYLVTGGAGFIGSNFIRRVLSSEPDSRITNLDALTYAGVPATVESLDRQRAHSFLHGDIRDPAVVNAAMPGHDVVVHFAAESHVDRSIDEPAVFLETNVVGTGNLLEAAMRNGVERFIHVSTDEVYGSIAQGKALESQRLNPSSPYAAAKAASDLLASSYHATFGLDVLITRCTNNYGPYQFPEKLISLFVTNLLLGRNVPLYGKGSNQREWIFVEDHCAAIHTLIEAGQAGEIYNIGSDVHTSNLELTKMLLKLLGADDSRVDHVEDRLGHDYRYAVDSSKIRALGWSPQHNLIDGIAATVDWYRTNEDWWQPLRGEG